ncbi:MAG: hypothetical protein ACD_2C00164G0004 [uncultured bacterium (gcode 4)]|uniref:Glycerophosphoryl diester phosphodiesterase membrane domain-containing protein n=1 Tax=uncultured bacterium (gcode 4) TaxID=1234023 RepID=K2G2Q1_9BACT|nr:MAG: hypothetical protein ACD_2C00164G0004 [uncultured bacterium (gcode 4)]
MKTNIVIPSWELVNHANVIKKFNFIPSLLSTIYLSVIVLYQVAYSYIMIFQKKDEFFSLVINFIHQSYFIEVVIWAIIWLLLYLLLQPIAEAWIIFMIDAFSKNDESKQKISYWTSQWLLNFLPLFEFHNFMWLFRLLSIVTFYFLLLRVFGQEYAIPISVIMWFYLVFAVWINLLFVYTKFFIIFEKKTVFEAVSSSISMSLNNMEITLKLFYTLFLVYARVIISIVVFTIFPLIFSALFAYVSTQIFFVVWTTIILIIFAAFLLFISHLNSVLEIFVEALWYNAFMENKKNSPDEEE